MGSTPIAGEGVRVGPADGLGGSAGGAGGEVIPAGSGGAAAGASGATGGIGDLPGCQSDDECTLPTAACDFNTARCVECTGPQYCASAVCDLNRNVCVDCLSADDCPSGACDVNTQRCVPCNNDDQCQDEQGQYGTCSADHKCVDCENGRGCEDPQKPACVQQNCVECDQQDDCSSQPGRPRCLRPQHVCVECLQRNGDCADSDRPICEVESHVCVQCLQDTDCTDGKRCVDQLCVQCKDDRDCQSADAARCDTDSNTCTGCTSDAQCAHLPQTPACDVDSGACVACVDDSTCDGYACIRSKHSCSDVKLGSLTLCAQCEADSQCKDNNARCASQGVSASEGTYYCLYNRALTGGCATTAGSPLRPFTRSVSGNSIDGARGPFCAPTASCEALHDASTPVGGKVCAVPSDCGIVGVNDGICLENNRCSYICEQSVDCPSNGLNTCQSKLCSGS